MRTMRAIPNIAMTFILTTSLSAFAQGPGGGRGGQGRQPPTPAVDSVLDANSDGVISADEIAGATSALVGLDTDHDGSLSFDECMGFSNGGGQQAPPSGRGGSGGQPPAPPVFSALDGSGDEVIDEYEISHAPESLLELDENGDGALQADEIRPSRHGGGMGGGSPRNR